MRLRWFLLCVKPLLSNVKKLLTPLPSQGQAESGPSQRAVKFAGSTCAPTGEPICFGGGPGPEESR